MNTYIALLRGINVGGHKKIKMADLKEIFEESGFKDVMTYIQSGNIVFRDATDHIADIEIKIKTAIKKRFDFDVPVFVITHENLNSFLEDNPFSKRLKNGEIDSKKMYFTLLCDRPDPLGVKELCSISLDPEEFIITERVIYLYPAMGYGQTKLTNTFFEKKLKCSTTTRNLRTMNKLLELSFLRK